MSVSPEPQHHTPVFLETVLSLLKDVKGPVVDATFGRGGYTRALLDQGQTVIALDRDEAAIAYGREHFGEALAAQKLFLVHTRFSQLEEALKTLAMQPGAIVFDLGVSSPQLENPKRGFSFQAAGPLDMRMGLSQNSAADFINAAPVEVLADVIKTYGEERFARKIARRIVEHRPFATTTELADLITQTVPRPGTGIHPATRTFQALRIHVNEEMEELGAALKASEKVLSTGGRLVVVSFHSGEDRLVKQFLHPPSPVLLSRHFPQKGMTVPIAFTGPRRSLKPTLTEIQQNPRARSAKLRWGERS
jgi:16S rRNA (cytosine1402-N4)-methyltransferase